MPKNPSICYGCCPKGAPSMQARDCPWCWSWEHQNSLLARMSSTKRKSESALSKRKKINANGILAHVSSDWDILPEKYWTNVEISHIYIYIYHILCRKMSKAPFPKGTNTGKLTWTQLWRLWDFASAKKHPWLHVKQPQVWSCFISMI